MILQRAQAARGVALEVRHDPMGLLELPGFGDVILATHIGAPAKLVCRRDGRHYRGTSVHGDLDLIPAQTPSRWGMLDDNDTTLLLSLPTSLLRAVADESGLDGARLEIRDRFQTRDLELETLCWAMQREVEMGAPSGRLYLEGLALAVASRVINRHSSFAQRLEQPNDGLHPRRLKQVLSFIEENLANDLSLDQIAAAAGISASHLSALFRKSMRTSVHRYLVQRRVEHAKTLLQKENLSLTEIALAAGFAHPSHLARQMRRVLGLTPKALRRLQAER